MPVFESSRKVQVSGSSLAMTLPALFVKSSAIEKGAVVKVLYDFDGILVVSQRDERQIKEGLVKILKELEGKKR